MKLGVISAGARESILQTLKMLINPKILFMMPIIASFTLLLTVFLVDISKVWQIIWRHLEDDKFIPFSLMSFIHALSRLSSHVLTAYTS